MTKCFGLYYKLVWEDLINVEIDPIVILICSKTFRFLKMLNIFGFRNNVKKRHLKNALKLILFSTSDFINVRPFMAALSNCVVLPYCCLRPTHLKKIQICPWNFNSFFFFFCFDAIQLHLEERLRAFFHAPRRKKTFEWLTDKNPRKHSHLFSYF